MLDDFTDEQLMERYQADDYDAFLLLYQRCQGRVYAYLRKHLVDMNAADDVFQNVFVKFHKSRMRYDASFPLMAWLYTICRCELLDYLKRPRARYVELDDSHVAVEYGEGGVEFDIDGEKRLTENEKAVLKLRYFSDQDYAQIARTLGFTQVSVRKTSSRGIRKLRLKYGGMHHA